MRNGANNDRRDAVILLHGLGRTHRSMERLGARLSEEGHRVVNVSYPSRRHEPEQLVEHVARDLRRNVDTDTRVHFVAHSLGGIIVRVLLANDPPSNLGRTVMLAPPNQGSELADLLSGRAPFRWILGPPLSHLGTREDSLPRRLPAAQFELGIIAGNGYVNPLGAAIVPRPNDGIVSVESTRLEGMTDFIAVNRSHTFIMNAPEVIDEVVHFLREGRFRRPNVNV
ncbi:MAG: alpha/beta fold hydrolase [Gammaproteobacteria bacterium]